MIPKEKAMNLVTSFSKILLNNGVRIGKDDAKNCALTCVDEILNTSPIVGYDYIPIGLKPHEYWKQVKTEIEKL